MLLASRVNWGSVPDWIAGVGTVLAFVGFAVAFLWEVKKRRQDDERDAEDRREALKRHARLVYMEIGAPGSSTQKRLVIHNDGTGPILDVVTTVWVRSPDSPEDFREIQLDHRNPDVTELGAGEAGNVWLWFADGEQLADSEEFFPQIEFTDCDGGRWRRRETEQPVRVADAGTGPNTASPQLRLLRRALVVAMVIAAAAVVLSIIALSRVGS
jgi:hypothetical protein